MAFVVLSFTTIVFTISSTRDGGTQHWYLFFSPLAIAASFYGVRGALVTGLFTFITIAFLYRNALIMLQSLPIDVHFVQDFMNLSPAVRLLGGDLNNAVMGTTIMLAIACGMGYLGDRSRRLERQVAFMADHDALTGLYNRRRFTDELQREIQRCRQTSGVSVLLYSDLDGFKAVNDKLGHAAGDDLLVHLAKILKDNTRDKDIIGRMGGDEFALLMPGVEPTVAAGVTERLLAAVAAHPIPDNGLGLRVTASIGAVRLEGASTPDARELLIKADEAMYQAKTAGKNRVRFAGDRAEPPAPVAAMPTQAPA